MSDYTSRGTNNSHVSKTTPPRRRSFSGILLIVLVCLVLAGVLIFKERSRVKDVVQGKSGEPTLYVVENKEVINGRYFVHVRRHSGTERQTYQVSRMDYESVSPSLVYPADTMTDWTPVSKAE